MVRACDYCKKVIEKYEFLRFEDLRGWCSMECWQNYIKREEQLKKKATAKA